MDYVGVLNEKYKEYRDKMEKAESVTELENIYAESVIFYEKNLIPSFFSSRGEGKRIKDMYEKLEERKYHKGIREVTIESVDLNVANGIYRDYLEGMQQFILETCESCIDHEMYLKESANCQNKLDTAKKNDRMFIESIFGGSNNKTQMETIFESTKNVEYLIDFIDYMKEETDQCKTVIQRVKDSIGINENGNQLLTESVRLMTESIHDYVHHTISQIFDSYNQITNKLSDETSGKDKTRRVHGFMIC